MRHSLPLPPAVLGVCGGDTCTSSTRFSGRSISIIVSATERHVRFALSPENSTWLTICCNLWGGDFVERSVWSYFHTTSSLCMKGARNFSFVSLIIFVKSKTSVSADTTRQLGCPNLSWRWWSTRMNQILFGGVSAGDMARLF